MHHAGVMQGSHMGQVGCGRFIVYAATLAVCRRTELSVMVACNLASFSRSAVRMRSSSLIRARSVCLTSPELRSSPSMLGVLGGAPTSPELSRRSRHIFVAGSEAVAGCAVEACAPVFFVSSCGPLHAQGSEPATSTRG